MISPWEEYNQTNGLVMIYSSRKKRRVMHVCRLHFLTLPISAAGRFYAILQESHSIAIDEYASMLFLQESYSTAIDE